jgi:hypothetical protein
MMTDCDATLGVGAYRDFSRGRKANSGPEFFASKGALP